MKRPPRSRSVSSSATHISLLSEHAESGSESELERRQVENRRRRVRATKYKLALKTKAGGIGKEDVKIDEKRTAVGNGGAAAVSFLEAIKKRISFPAIGFCFSRRFDDDASIF
jgi:superfamily II RNA helicase